MPLPILQLVRRPGIIDLGWGHPDPALLPVEAVRRAFEAALRRYGADVLNYGYAAGAGPLREWLRDRIGRQEGRRPAPDEVVITGGISAGLDLLLTLSTSPGDVVLVESPTYHLAIRILRDHPLELLAVPADEQGLGVDALAETLGGLKRTGRRPRALYTVPTFNNPTGASLGDERRRALVELAASERLLVIEDDAYRELAYGGPPPPSLWSLAPPGVVARLGSFSKPLAPGLRLGWLTAGSEIGARVADCGVLDSGGGVNHATAMAVAQLCQAGDFDEQVLRLRAAYGERRDALVAALRHQLPEGCAVSEPGGGFFVWVTLPPAMDSEALLPAAEAAGVSYVPGCRFYLDGDGRPSVRLSVSLYPPTDLEEGARRLASAVARAKPGNRGA